MVKPAALQPVCPIAIALLVVLYAGPAQIHAEPAERSHAAPAVQRQHIINPGDNWQRLEGQLRPGDQIVLRPGLHQPARFKGIEGEPDRPITIRGLSADECVIYGGSVGLTFIDSRHIRVESVTFAGADLSAIVVETSDSEEQRRSEHIRFENVTIRDVGSRRDRPAVRLQGASSIRLTDMMIENWGGSAVEISGGSSIQIQSLRTVADRNFAPHRIIRISAGTRRVRITGCTFMGTVQQGLTIGQPSSSAATGRAVSDEKPHKRSSPDRPRGGGHGGISGGQVRTEVQIENCLFDQVNWPIILIQPLRVTIRNNTFVRPTGAVLVLSRDDAESSEQSPALSNFGQNLVIWHEGDMSGVVVGGEEVSPIVFEQNLWWLEGHPSPGGLDLTLPGRVGFEQLTDVDPQLDSDRRPTNPRASAFGMRFR